MNIEILQFYKQTKEVSHGRLCGPHLKGFSVKLDGLFDVALLPFDIGQVVERVGVGGAQAQRRVVAVFRLRHLEEA